MHDLQDIMRNMREAKTIDDLLKWWNLGLTKLSQEAAEKAHELGYDDGTKDAEQESD